MKNLALYCLVLGFALMLFGCASFPMTVYYSFPLWFVCVASVLLIASAVLYSVSSFNK